MPLPGLAQKPTYEIAVDSRHGTRWFHRPQVPADRMLEVLTDWMVAVHGPALIIRIDGEDFTSTVWATLSREVARRRGQPLPPEPEESRGAGHLNVATAWRFRLTDGNVLHRLPLAAEVSSDKVLRGGTGPGDLAWQMIEEHGVPGLRAVYRGGMFKILRVSTDRHALVYERMSGDWEAIALGPPEALKKRAATSLTKRAPRIDFAGLMKLIPSERRNG